MSTYTDSSGTHFTLHNGANPHDSWNDLKARMVANINLPLSQQAMYFRSTEYVDFEANHQNPNMSGVPAAQMYKKVTQLEQSDGSYHEINGHEHLAIYTPLVQHANMQQLGGSTFSVPHNIVAFQGTQSLYDVFTDLKIGLAYYLNSYLSNLTQSIDQEVDTMWEQMKLFLENDTRPVEVVGYSLGAQYALRLFRKIHEESGPLNVAGIKLKLLIPYLLADEHYEYFRTGAGSVLRNHIELHCISGDMVTGLISSWGIGNVYLYNSVSTPPQPNPELLLNSNANLNNWLIAQQFSGSNTVLRGNYLSLDNHKLNSFMIQSNTPLTLAYYATYSDTWDLVSPLVTNNNKLSLQHVKQSLVATDGTTSDYTLQNMMVKDIANRGANDSNLYFDHIHTNELEEYYEWSVNATPENSQYIYSTGVNGEGYIAFPHKLTNVETSWTRDFWFIYENGAWLLSNDGTTVIALPLNPTRFSSITTSLQYYSSNKYFRKYDNNDYLNLGTGPTGQTRYTFDLLSTYNPTGPRRSLTPVTYGILSTYMGSPIIPIKMKMTLFSNYDNTNKTYYIGQWQGGGANVGKDYVFVSTYQNDGTTHDQDWSETSHTTWELELYDNSSTNFVYKITNKDNDTSLGTNFSTSFYDEFEIIQDSVINSTSITGYIKYAHPNGTNYYLSIVDSSGTDPDGTLIIGAYTQVKWIPQTNLSTTTQAKWTIYTI